MASYDEQAAESYDDVHGDVLAEAEDAAARLAELAGAGPVLELGVGTGRVAIPLARRGLVVHGIDVSAAMVERMRAKRGGDRIGVVMGDFADVGSLVDGTYSIVFVAFNTLFELPGQEAQARCFSGVAGHLSTGGFFVVEAFVPDVTTLDQSVSVVALDGDSVVLQATRHDPAGQRVELRNVTLSSDGVSTEGFSVRYATVAELDLMAHHAGLRLRERWAGWKREPFTASSTRHVSVYQKR